MSWSISMSGKARDVEAQIEHQGVAVKHGRNGFEQKAIDLCVSDLREAVKHASLTDHDVSVSASGHHDDAGCGFFSLRVDIAAAAQSEPASTSQED